VTLFDLISLVVIIDYYIIISDYSLPVDTVCFCNWSVEDIRVFTECELFTGVGEVQKGLDSDTPCLSNDLAQYRHSLQLCPLSL